MNVSKIPKIAEIKTREYSLDSLNEFLKIEEEDQFSNPTPKIAQQRMLPADNTLDMKRKKKKARNCNANEKETVERLEAEVFYSSKQEPKEITHSTLNQESTYLMESRTLEKTQEAAKILSNHRHHPQIIDRDTEVFKGKLETLLHQFKVETLTEYIEAKKSLLEEQASIIGGEKNQFELKLNTKIVEVLIESYNLA